MDPDEESEFAVRYLKEEGEDGDEDGGDEDLLEAEDEPPGGLGRMQPEGW